MLAACYGAWIGDWATRTLAAHWIGLDEPHAPRIVIGGVLCSPIDTLRRFLAGADAVHALAWMAARMTEWEKAASEPLNDLQQNESAWDQLADDDRFAGDIDLPADAESAIAALDPWLQADWKPGCRLLCLAAGGGRQGPLHAIAGAEVTVVDLSQRQLEHDRRVAARMGISLSLIHGSADRLTGIQAGAFDVVVQPVSGCYVADLRAMYAEVARVLRPGGIYLVQHKQPLSLRLKPSADGGYQLAEPVVQHRPLPMLASADLPEHPDREPGTLEFAHSLQSLIGELCSAGFVIEQFAEPPRADAFALPGSAEHKACFAPPYLRLKAIRKRDKLHQAAGLG